MGEPATTQFAHKRVDEVPDDAHVLERAATGCAALISLGFTASKRLGDTSC